MKSRAKKKYPIKPKKTTLNTVRILVNAKRRLSKKQHVESEDQRETCYLASISMH